MTLLEAESLTVKYGALTAVDSVSFSLEEGQWLMLAGPNGAGKSTLINAVSRFISCSGTVRCMGQDIGRFSPKRLARCMGVLSQSHQVGYSFTVEEVVRLGRYPYSGGALGGGSGEDEKMVEQALEQAGLRELRHHSVLTLSGGELQRTFLAQVMAQNPKILILDEPANHLDLVYQKQVFSLIRQWLSQGGRAAVSAIHDLSLAKAYGTHALLLEDGRTVSQGETESVLTPENLRRAYSMDVYSWMSEMLGQWKR